MQYSKQPPDQIMHFLNPKHIRKMKSVQNLTSPTNSHVGKSYVPESRVVVFGNPGDPEVAKSIKKLKEQGRDAFAGGRPSFDTGMGKCGNHLCHCKDHCQAEFKTDVAI
jgi:hypothetical protein